MIFVFTTLLELVAALVFKTYLSHQSKKQNQVGSTSKASWVKSTDDNKKNVLVLTSDDIEKKVAFAERCFTLLYFAIFLAFCVIYWLSISAVDV